MKISMVALMALCFSNFAAAGSDSPYDAGSWKLGELTAYDAFANGIQVGTLRRQVTRVTELTVTVKGFLDLDFGRDMLTESVYNRDTSDLVSVSVNGRKLNSIRQWSFGPGEDDIANVPAGEFEVQRYAAINYLGEQDTLWINTK